MSTLTEAAGGVDVRDNSDHLVGAIATAEDDDENFNAVYVTGPSYRGDATREHLPTETDQRIFVLSRPIFAILQPKRRELRDRRADRLRCGLDIRSGWHRADEGRGRFVHG